MENLVLFENATDVTVKMKTVKFTLFLFNQERVYEWISQKLKGENGRKGQGNLSDTRSTRIRGLAVALVIQAFTLPAKHT